MGKNITILALVQLILSYVSAELMGRMSFIGRQGINFVYTQYTVLKTPWKTALIIFSIQLILILILAMFKFFTARYISITVIVFALLAGFAGAYYTFLDLTTTSHKTMGTMFRIGSYLFWGSWTITCLFFMFLRKKKLPLHQLDIVNEERKEEQEEKPTN
ncbi:cytochrome d ubiquinol oxidase subunit II [Myroides sp. BIT-d1]|uniref:Cytochrome d ubiquinol oxidase subunit II n=1 Tax=Myroides albus TaxID=2562892 RepID=A0A6I3LFV0_9FLAO|nr:cytochrome d ubiquinol oxidase subunit II [Myroides albus]MTG96674.1 cytochrome d ubiquinol oxidase subunit II [Myroides albus]